MIKVKAQPNWHSDVSPGKKKENEKNWQSRLSPDKQVYEAALVVEGKSR